MDRDALYRQDTEMQDTFTDSPATQGVGMSLNPGDLVLDFEEEPGLVIEIQSTFPRYLGQPYSFEDPWIVYLDCEGRLSKELQHNLTKVS